MSRRRVSLEQQEKRVVKRAARYGKKRLADEVVRALATPPAPGARWMDLIGDVQEQIKRDTGVLLNAFEIEAVMGFDSLSTPALAPAHAQGQPTAEPIAAPSIQASVAVASRSR